jgi:hypothetical protein
VSPLIRESFCKVGLVLTLAIFLGVGFMMTDAEARRRRRRSKVIRLGEFKIEGTIQKPQAFYILQRSNLNFEGLELKNSFLPKIVESVNKAPF